MINKRHFTNFISLQFIATVFFLFTWNVNLAQKFLPVSQKLKFSEGKSGDLFGKKKSFIKNIGQYGAVVKNYESMGSILYGYEGSDMPVLFTSKGLIHLQRKTEKLSDNSNDENEKR